MEFKIETDMIDVTSMPRYITIHKITGKEIPSVYRGKYYCSDCGDDHKEYTFDKRFNTKNFLEKWVGGGIYKEFAPGLKHFYIDGVEVGESEFENKIEYSAHLKSHSLVGSD